MKVTPTTLKKLDQRNIELDRSFYTNHELAKLLSEDIIFAIGRKGELYRSETCNCDPYWIVIDKENYLAISLDTVSEVKIVIEVDHMLRTVAVVNGVQYFVKI